jgi:sodium/hydrogen exchanger 8
MVETGGLEWHQTNRGVSIYITLYLALFASVILLAKFLHDRPALASILPEAAMTISLGLLAGWVVYLVVDTGEGYVDDDAIAQEVAGSLLYFSPTVFFVILLPPIIFNSGYHVQRTVFFRHIAPICLFACIGTGIATLVVAGFLQAVSGLYPDSFQPTFLELLAFGALISATDPVSTLAVFQSKRVDPHLFYLVFGESVINDAVGLVLFEALAHLVENNLGDEGQTDFGAAFAQFLFDFVLGFIGSMLLGYLFGVGVAFLFKVVDMRSTPLLELCLYVPIMYAPFVIAEIARLSGIVTVLFTGISARRYAEPNLSKQTAKNAATIFRLVAHITETVIFLELGLSVFGLTSHVHFNWAFILLALLACLIGRACNIYPITFLYNLLSRDPQKNHDGILVEKCDEDAIDDRKIPWSTAHMLWFSGLRGAVSYGLVKTFPETGNKVDFVVTTMCIVLVTTFVLGGTTELALKFLKIPMGVDEDSYMKNLTPRQFLRGWLHRFEGYQLRGWVIRDFKNTTPEDTEPDDTAYSQHVEMTEFDHALTIQREEDERKTTSVYDFGRMRGS